MYWRILQIGKVMRRKIMSNNKKAAIITFISQRHDNSEEKEYTLEYGNKKIIGRYTNDAPIKYLIDKAREDGNVVDRIIAIVSKAVYMEHIEKESGKTSDSILNICRDMVDEYAGNAYEIKWCPVAYDFKVDKLDLDFNGEINKEIVFDDIKTQQEKISAVYDGIISKLGECEEVYIDYAGGLRDINFLIAVLIRYLEFINVKCREIVYSNLKEAKLYSLLCAYDIFKLINAVNQFVDTGNAKLLKEIYDTIEHKGIKELINVMNEFSQSIQLCDVRRIGTVVEKLNESIEALEAQNSNKISEQLRVNVETENISGSMFGRLLSVIKKKFGDVGKIGRDKENLCDSVKISELHLNNLAKEINSGEGMLGEIQVSMFSELLSVIKKKFYIIDDEEQVGVDYKRFTYPKLIKWCLDNNLIQQALTLYVEKMPVEYYEKYLKISDEDKADYLEKKNGGLSSTKEEEYFYTRLYENIGNTVLPDMRNLKSLKDIIEECKNEKFTLKDNIEDEIFTSDGEVKIALIEIRNFLESHYEGESYESKREDVLDWTLAGVKFNAKTGYKFLNSLYAKPRVLKGLLEGKEAAEIEELGVYGKKINVLVALNEGVDVSAYVEKLSIEELVGIMEHYLLIKHFRNNINHASEKETTEETDILKRYFEKKGKSIDINFENVYTIISEGLRITNPQLF